MAQAIFQAVADCRFKQMELLHRCGVSMEVRNFNGETLLIASLFIINEKCRKRFFGYFLRNDVDPLQRDDVLDRNALSWACYLGRKAQVEALIALGEVDLLEKDATGSIALHLAVQSNNLEVARVIIQTMCKYRLCLDVHDGEGLTPYMVAKKLGLQDMAELLLVEGEVNPSKFDDKLFLTAEEWAEVGVKEREQLAKEKNSKTPKPYTSYNIRQRRYSYLPNIDRRHQRDTFYLDELDTDYCGVSPEASTLPSLNNKHSLSSMNGNNNVTLATGNTLTAGRSIDSALSLLELSEGCTQATEFHASEHVHGGSQNDLSGDVWCLSEMLTSLAIQQGESYRTTVQYNPAAPQLTPKVIQPPKRKPRLRRNGSTLAALFGKQKRTFSCQSFKGLGKLNSGTNKITRPIKTAPTKNKYETDGTGKSARVCDNKKPILRRHSTL